MPVAVILGNTAAVGAAPSGRHSLLPVMGVGLIPMLIMLVLGCL
jgi:hypothetical protein